MTKQLRSVFIEHERVLKRFDLPTMAKQSFKEECDINTIMKKYEKTGLIDHNSRYRGRYEDVSGAVDLHEAMGIVQAAEEAFSSLTAKIRKRFDNEPGKFLEFAQNPENLEAMREMGLAAPTEPAESPPDPPEPEKVPAKPPVPDPPEAA